MVSQRDLLSAHFNVLFPTVIEMFLFFNWLIGLVGKVFANRLGDLGLIPGCHTKDF